MPWFLFQNNVLQRIASVTHFKSSAGNGKLVETKTTSAAIATGYAPLINGVQCSREDSAGRYGKPGLLPPKPNTIVIQVRIVGPLGMVFVGISEILRPQKLRRQLVIPLKLRCYVSLWSCVQAVSAHVLGIMTFFWDMKSLVL
jgi:hypothetical protein